MCFSFEMSAGFAFFGLITSWWVYTRTASTPLAIGVFFFFTMEFLQAIQYLFIAETLESPGCDAFANKFLTILGFLHICMQPYVCHYINAALTVNPVLKERYVVVNRLCLIAGLMLFGRVLLAVFPEYVTMDVSNQRSTEWLRGEKFCTFRGNYHLAWSVPMADPSYFVPSVALHFFCMFAPYFAMYEKRGNVGQAVLLFLTGPYLASFITPNLMEQASIWCFFSIAQISVLLVEPVLEVWGFLKVRTEGIVIKAAHSKSEAFQASEKAEVLG